MREMNLGKRPREDREKSPSRQYREGEKRRSDQAPEDDPTSKRPKIDFATRQYQLHEHQQPQATLGEQLYILEQQHYEMYKQIQTIKEQHQAGSSNIVTRDFLMPLDQKQAIQMQRDEARKQQQEAGPSRQGDPSSRPDHLELSTDDFEFGSIELRDPHDQTQVTSYQSFPEIQHPFAAHHPPKAQRVEQRQDTLMQQYEGHNQVGSHDYNRDLADRAQTSQSFETHKKMRKYSPDSSIDSNIAESFINSLPGRYRQAYAAYRDGRYSKEGEAIYQFWSVVYTGVSWEHQQKIAREVDQKLEQHNKQWHKKNQ